MAANNRRRLSFIDPYHLLMKMDYEGGQCDVCLLQLAGHDGYGCDSCNIHIHRACADCFGETTSFFAHQSSQAFRLRRCGPPPPQVGRISCSICGGCCPPGSFVYRSTDCDFNVHPLCSKLPERAGSPSPLYPGHEAHNLSMVYSPGCSCSACRYPLPMWHYSCSCSSLKLHISCASFGPPPPTVGQRYGPFSFGGYPTIPGYNPLRPAVTQQRGLIWQPPIQQVNYDDGASGSGRQSIFDNRIVIATAKLLSHVVAVGRIPGSGLEYKE